MSAPNDFTLHLIAGTLDYTWPALNTAREGGADISSGAYHALTALTEAMRAAIAHPELGPILRKRINTDAADFFAAKIKRVFEGEK